MPIPVSCPNCSTTLKAPDTAAGRKVRCPKCSTPFDVPAPPSADVADVAEVVEDTGVRHSAPPPPLPARRPAPVRAYADDEGYDDDLPPIRRRRQQEPEGPGTGLQMGLGIASLSVGAGGLIIAMIPCVGFIPGLVGAGTGLVLGLIGLIVAMTQKNRGIAFPIAGSATSVVGLLVAVVWYMLILRTVNEGVQFANQGINLANKMQQNAFDLAQKMKDQKFAKGPFGGNPFDGNAPQKERSANNLRQIGIAFHNFNAMHKAFPRAKSDGKNGLGKLSWRVALLPDLEHQQLYNQFKLNEPWDSPHNIKLLNQMPDVYRPTAGFAPPGQTYYQVFTGPNTPFKEDGPARLPGSFPDGTANTFLVVEGGNPVPWTKPDDISFNRNGPLPRIGGNMFPDGFNAVFADGSARFIRRALYNDNLLRDLIDPADGKAVNLPD